jgi:sulfate-transporting ATPase
LTPLFLHVGVAQYVFTMNRVGKIVPPKRFILKDISLSFFPGAKIGVLGLNGSGKSTLLRSWPASTRIIEGEAARMPGIKIGYLPQEPQLDPGQTVRQGRGRPGRDLRRARRARRGLRRLRREGRRFRRKLAAEQARLEAILAAATADTAEQPARSRRRRAAPAARGMRTIGKLSGGEKRRVALCRLLLSKPDMLLLDEPTNHLDAESVEWLEQFLARFPGTVVAVTHDRYFLDNAAEWILELDRGQRHPVEGQLLLVARAEGRTPEAGREARKSARQKAIKKELEWVRQNPRADARPRARRVCALRGTVAVEYQKRNETRRSSFPGPSASATR